jgi:GPI mannosyltransferase 3
LTNGVFFHQIFVSTLKVPIMVKFPQVFRINAQGRNFIKKNYIYILSILALFITACFSSGYYHFDEHFQILEFAGLKLYMTVATNLPWEYTYQMRPAIQPAIVILVYKFFIALGISSPFTIAIVLRILSAAVSFTGMYLIYKAFNKSFLDATLKLWFSLLSFFLWFIIFENVRFSSENWSGSIFLIAFSLLYINQSKGKKLFFSVGLLLGLSFLFRYQTGFLIGGLICWHLVMKKNIGNTVLMILGILILFGAGILIDRWFYGNWTLTTWNYFNQNILQNRVSDFGIRPWWYYLERIFIEGIPPFSLIYIASFVLFFIFKRKDLLTWTLLPFILIHFIIGHKEIRFLFPLIGFIPVIIIKSVEIIQEHWKSGFSDLKPVKIFVRLFWIVNLIFLIIIAFTPADGQISLYRKVYSEYKSPATLYYTEDNPYNRVLDINFYKRATLEIVQIDSIGKIDQNANRKQLFVTKDKNTLNDLRTQKRLIYSSFPDWIRIFNFNNWMARTNCWYVYELH